MDSPIKVQWFAVGKIVHLYTHNLFQQHTSGYSGPLRCETAHIYSVACQLMALKLMKWLSIITEDSGKYKTDNVLYHTMCIVEL